MLLLIRLEMLSSPTQKKYLFLMSKFLLLCISIRSSFTQSDGLSLCVAQRQLYYSFTAVQLYYSLLSISLRIPAAFKCTKIPKKDPKLYKTEKIISTLVRTLLCETIFFKPKKICLIFSVYTVLWTVCPCLFKPKSQFLRLAPL